MKRKVLFIIHLPPPLHGAAMVGKYVADSKVLREAVDADFINLSASAELNEIGRMGLRKMLRICSLVVQVLRAITIKRYDLCYLSISARGPGFYKDMLLVMILRLFRKKLVYHFHNKGVSKSESKFQKMCYRYVLSRQNCILLSPLLYYDIAEYVQPQYVRYCWNGVPSLQTEKSSRVGEPCRLLYLSNMMKEKGVYELLRACGELKKRSLKFSCDFVGSWMDVSEAEFNREVTMLGLESEVKGHGKKVGDEKMRFLEQADIFVFPTYYDCFPLSVLEAMQFSLPVISTDEGGVPDIVEQGKTGYIVERRSVSELTDRLEELILDSQKRIAMGEAGYQRFEENFTLEKFEQRFTQIITELADAK
jgi:glycosyltransferase involved in cell wall biosynthesis